MKITMTAIIERQRARLYTQKAKKNGKHLYTKKHTLIKKLDNFRYVFIYKKPYTWRYGIFMKFFKLAFIYKKDDTVLCVTWRFYIQKARHFAKSKIICDTFLYTKIWHFALRDFSLDSWNLRRGGAFIYWKNHALCVTFLYWKNMALCVTLL